MVFLEVGENAVVQAAGLMSEVKIFLRRLVEGVFKCNFIIYH